MRRIALYISIVLLFVGCNDEDGVEHSYNSIASLWSYVERGTMPLTEDIYLCGYVVANDKLNELRGAIVVADSSGGVVVEVDMEDVDRHFPLYSRVEVRCSGLWLANVGPKLLLGAEPASSSVVDDIPASMVGNYLSLLPHNEDTPSLRTCNVAELGYRDILSRVVVSNLRLVDDEVGLCWTDLDTLTGRRITTVRHLCQDGDTLRVVVDGDCRYASEYIPATDLRLSGILDWYQADVALRIINHGIDRNYR